MKYPKEVIAITSKGKKEVRIFLERGKYVRYTYADPETGKIVKKGKEAVFLKSEKGKYVEFFVVPIGEKKNLLFKIKEKEEKVKKRKVWLKEKKKAIPLFKN